MRFFNYYAARPWAMEQSAYRGLMQSLMALESDAVLARLPEDAAQAPASAAPKAPRPTSGGVAVLPIHGPIYQEATYLNQLIAAILGGTITDIFHAQFKMAMADPDVKAILFDVNSPGGEAMGLDTVAEEIFKSRGQGKPIIAHVNGQNCSAAYYLASAADSIISTKDSMHGSIGSVISMVNFDKLLENIGIEEIDFVSSVSPKKRPDEMTDEGRELYQALVDSYGKNFVDAVARNRGVSASTVKSEYGQGWIKVGSEALKAGMIDGLAPLDKTVAQLISGRVPAKKMPGGKNTMTLGQILNAPLHMLGIAGTGEPTDESPSLTAEPHSVTVPANGAGEPTPAPEPAAAPVQPASHFTIAGKSEAEIRDIIARDEANQARILEHQEAAAADFAAKYAGRYLENGAPATSSEAEVLSDRAKATAVLQAMHLKAARREAIGVEELEAFAAIPTADSILPTGTLDDADLKGANGSQDNAPKDDKQEAADKALRAVNSQYQGTINSLQGKGA